MNFQFDRNKILLHLDVINEYTSTGTTAAPVTVELDLTNVCNHDCPGCSGFREEGGLNSFIETDDAKRIILEIKDCGVKGITFTGGGDPTMHKSFDEIIAFAYGLGLDVGLITNGLSLKEKHLQNLMPACTWIRVSWDAATPELHDKIHYNGGLGILMTSPQKFWQVVDNTKMLSQYKKDHQYKTTVGCAFLVGPTTKHEITGFAELASKSGVDYCQYRPFHYIENDLDYEVLMKDSRSKYERDDFKVLFSEFKFNTLKEEEIKRTYNICHGSHFVTHVAANYNVYVCCHLMNRDFACIGNLKDRSFIEVWRNRKKTEVIDGIDVHKCLPLCRSDSANRLLETIKNKPLNHANFL